MEHEARKYLWDARKAADAVARFAEGKTFDDYLADDLLRSAVERQLQNVGEAIAQLAKLDTRTAERVPGFREIVAFRNILVHGYALLDNRLVWRGGRGGRSETARRRRAAAGRGGQGLGTAAPQPRGAAVFPRPSFRPHGSSLRLARGQAPRSGEPESRKPTLDSRLRGNDAMGVAGTPYLAVIPAIIHRI